MSILHTLYHIRILTWSFGAPISRAELKRLLAAAFGFGEALLRAARGLPGSGRGFLCSRPVCMYIYIYM